MIIDPRWEKLNQFIALWHRPLVPEDGYSSEEITAVEAELAIRFPDALREWYLAAGRWYQLLQVQDYQLELDELDLDEDTLVFQVENQEVCIWSVHQEDFDKPDPPVYDEENEAVQSERLSDFLLCSVIKETAWACCEETVTGQGKAGLFTVLDSNFTLWFADSDFERYYATDDAIAIAGQDPEGGTWIMLSAKTQDALVRYKAPFSKEVRWQ